VSADRLRRAVPRALVLAAVVTLTGCDWFTDFKEQPKIDPWDTPADTIPPRANPAWSVPITGNTAPGYAYAYGANQQAIMAMAGLVNPMPADSGSLHRGRLLYQANCAVCHGVAGQSNMVGAQYRLPPGPPLGPGSNAANNLSDGYLYGIIRNGRNTMPSYSRIEDSERWDVVNYMRALQGRGAAPADTTFGRPGEAGIHSPGASRTAPTRPAPWRSATPTMPRPATAILPDTTNGA
jgi:mono/diheme cytochrome c family protein